MMYACFCCGETGHVKAECPNRTRPRPAPPAPGPSAGAQPPVFKAAEVTPCAVARRRVLYFGWARSAATRMGGGLVVRTPFRDRAGLLPRTEGQLRAMALAQVAESRAGR